METMKLSKKEYRAANRALKQWQDEQIINADQYQRMQNTLELKTFDWQYLARLAFFAGVACLVVAFLAVLDDQELMAFLEHLFNTGPVVKSLFFAIVTLALWYRGVLVRQKQPDRILGYYPLFFLGVISTAFAVYFLGEAIGSDSEYISPLFLLATIIYLLAGLTIQSRLIWGCALLVAGVWFGLETVYWSGEDYLFFGLSFPVRYLPFGIAVYLISFLIRSRFPGAYTLTRIIGLSYFFIALWLSSFFGNEDWFGDYGRFEFLPWGLLLFAVSGFTIWYGAKVNDDLLREFGVVFFLIGAYSRYFEYGWGEMHDALFFIILAASLWLVGKYSERLWFLGK